MDALTFYKLAKAFKHINAFSATVQSAHETWNWTSYLWLNAFNGAALKAMQDSTYSCRWKTESGFVELTAPQILAIADAVRAHVQACFDREAELLPLIEAAESQEELNAITW